MSTDKATVTTKTYTELVKRKIASVTQLTKDVILFKFEEGPDWRMYHDFDCCERVEVDHLPDFSSMIGQELGKVTKLAVECGGSYGSDFESFTYTRFTFRDMRWNTIHISWLGESNGYYYEGVDFGPVTG